MKISQLDDHVTSILNFAEVVKHLKLFTIKQICLISHRPHVITITLYEIPGVVDVVICALPLKQFTDQAREIKLLV